MKKTEEKVLLYQFADAELTSVREVLRKLQIKSECLPEDAWRQKVGYLLGIKGFAAAGKSDELEDFVFPHEVLVFSNIKNKRLDQVLAAFREAGIPHIKFKAVVTPFNTFWTLRRLCETMQKEHAAMAEQASKEDQSV